MKRNCFGCLLVYFIHKKLNCIFYSSWWRNKTKRWKIYVKDIEKKLKEWKKNIIRFGFYHNFLPSFLPILWKEILNPKTVGDVMATQLFGDRTNTLKARILIHRLSLRKTIRPLYLKFSCFFFQIMENEKNIFRKVTVAKQQILHS